MEQKKPNTKEFSMCLLLSGVPTLCDPMDSSPPGSSVRQISQARILEWVSISKYMPMGLQRVGHNWVAEQHLNKLKKQGKANLWY